jgi:hypothetical protein
LPSGTAAFFFAMNSFSASSIAGSSAEMAARADLADGVERLAVLAQVHPFASTCIITASQ